MSNKMLEDARLKAALSAATRTRTLEFYALAFSKVPDKQGDIIAKDAADEWLTRFYAAGKPLPVSFTHAAIRQPEDPYNIIGFAPADPKHVFKDDHGIRVIAELDTETNPTAAQVYSLVKRGIITGSSLAYFTTTEGQRYMDDGSVLITKIEDILEAGPCLDPANEDAYVIAVKAMNDPTPPVLDPEVKVPENDDLILVKSGRTIAAVNMAKLRAAHELIQELLALGEPTVAEPEEKAHSANEEDPNAGNSEEPKSPNAWLRDALDEAAASAAS